jgi:hypothetical protein
MTDKESLTGSEQDVQIEEQTKHAMKNYSQWLQNAMSASPWGNTELNKTSELCDEKRFNCRWTVQKISNK